MALATVHTEYLILVVSVYHLLFEHTTWEKMPTSILVCSPNVNNMKRFKLGFTFQGLLIILSFTEASINPGLF